ncbi:SprB repeat-containing protein, partial [Flavobacterium sp.]|uniref:beta strand repeat-containing protein n=1 Tax=Flavobacterium sp. TaxID=239 RepID=UPI0025D9D114
MKGKVLLLLSLLFINYSNSQNLLSNPGFETGGSGVGFVTNGAGYTQLNAPFSGTTITGNFAIANNPKLVNTANFISEGDHTSGNGKMLIIDGNTTAGSPRFWKAGNTGTGVAGLTIGTTYRFSYWIKSVSNLGSPADIAILITGGTALLTSGTTLAPIPSLSWRQVIYTFVATATTATIELWNSNTTTAGNDFAVDDFMLTSDLMVSYNVTNAVCAVGNNGSVTVTAFGGTPPYLTYNITGSGATNVNNNNGIFTGLQPGTYSVSVTDSALPIATTTTLSNVIVGPAITILTTNGNNATTCLGSPITLTASGSSASYLWSAVPADATLTTPSIANPSVTPIVPTVYTVTSTVGSCASIVKSVSVGVSPLPTASISGTTTICNGATTVITFAGTPNATVTYIINGGANQTILLDNSGNATLTTPPITSETTYSLVSVISAGPSFCTKNVVGFAKISLQLQLGITAVPNPICVGGTSALKATGFTLSTAAGVSLNPMIGATTVINSAVDNTPSAATGIGFTFNFSGVDFTQLSISPDGWILFGGAAASNQSVNITTSSINTPKLYPFWDDLTTGTNGNVKILVTGIAPNRIFIAEWNVTVPKNIAAAANSTFQIWLYETTNVIEYHYGTIGAQTSNSISAGYTVSAANYSSLTFATNSASTTAVNDSNNSVPIFGTTYTYAPLATLIWSPTLNLYNDVAATIPYTGDSRALVYATNVPLAGTTYTVTGTNVASCSATSNIAVSVTVPNVTSTSAAQTICPGNTATFAITGTPNSTVTLVNPTVIPLTTTVAIGPLGTGSFTTPILNASVVYQFTKIKGFFTLCETNLIPATLTLSITVVPNGCATVKTDAATGTRPLDLTLCTTGECRTLQANFSPVPSTTGYAVSSIPYCPQAAFNDPSFIQFPIVNDDTYSPVFTLPFDFCFYGTNFNSVQIGDNGVISFGSNYAPGVFGENAYVQDLPFENSNFPNVSGQGTDSPFRNMICGVYQDTNTSVVPAAPAVRSINYQLVGTYPCRKLIVNFSNVGQFSCGTSVGLQSSQIVLYEISNIVEIYVKNRSSCTTWNGGNGAIGIKGGGAIPPYSTPPGRNTGTWSATNEAWRFTPTGPNVPVTIDWFVGATNIGTGPTINVCPAATTTYTLQATYQVCGVPQTATTTATLNVKTDLTGTPQDIPVCFPNNVFDLTSNNSVILGALSATDYDISYHTSQADADLGSNPIAVPTAYSPGTAIGSYPVYASIFLNSFNCRVAKSFNLIINNCTVQPAPVTIAAQCDDPSNDGIAIFDFTPLTPIALGSNSAANYTVTYHLSQTDADTIGSPGINPINNFLGTNGQVIIIRITDNSNASFFGTRPFTLTVNPVPIASIAGTTTICCGSNTVITFN